MGVKTIPIVNLCHGRNLLKSPVPNAAAIWWKEEINWHAPINNADIVRTA